MLSERGQAILRQVGTRLSEGYTPGEIGRELGISRRLVLALVDELRTETIRLSPSRPVNISPS
jgi:DNA-binding CsgD family transcriptional regulator